MKSVTHTGNSVGAPYTLQLTPWHHQGNRSKSSSISSPSGTPSFAVETLPSVPPFCWSPPHCYNNLLTPAPLLQPLCFSIALLDTHPTLPGLTFPQHCAAGNVMQGGVGRAPVYLRQKRLQGCCLFYLDALLQGNATGERHKVNIMLICHFLWCTDSGRSFAQQ